MDSHLHAGVSTIETMQMLQTNTQVAFISPGHQQARRLIDYPGLHRIWSTTNPQHKLVEPFSMHLLGLESIRNMAACKHAYVPAVISTPSESYGAGATPEVHAP